MYEITYGPKYDKTLSRVEIAERFRQDVKAAISSDALPKGLKLSVRTKGYSGGGSIDVTIKAVPAGFRILSLARLQEDATNRRGAAPEPWATPEARTLLDQLDKMLNAYNFDGSDIQSDYFNVRFYGGVEFDSRLTGAEREAFAASPPAPVLAVVQEVKSEQVQFLEALGVD